MCTNNRFDILSKKSIFCVAETSIAVSMLTS